MWEQRAFAWLNLHTTIVSLLQLRAVTRSKAVKQWKLKGNKQLEQCCRKLLFLHGDDSSMGVQCRQRRHLGRTCKAPVSVALAEIGLLPTTNHFISKAHPPRPNYDSGHGKPRGAGVRAGGRSCFLNCVAKSGS
eukprot:639927-Pelagomonas_calceolata.AAC.1